MLTTISEASSMKYSRPDKHSLEKKKDECLAKLPSEAAMEYSSAAATLVKSKKGFSSSVNEPLKIHASETFCIYVSEPLGYMCHLR